MSGRKPTPDVMGNLLNGTATKAKGQGTMKIFIAILIAILLSTSMAGKAQAQGTQTGCYDAKSRRYLCRVTTQDTYNTQRQSAYRAGRAGRSGARR